MSAKISVSKEQIVHEIKGVPEEYLPNLLQVVRLFRESIALKPAEASFRKGWEEALAGEAKPVSELWEGIDAE
ncbi:MAG: hypothetical protein KAV25_01425 [Methanophagales archaeon]|nr:hypothetical protein [Methanophagales archaeon]